jgi:universal stress protein A
MTKFEHILVPVDFDPPSLRALDIALDLAHAFGAKLTVLHAWDIAPYEYAGALYFPAELWADVEAAAKRQLDAVIGRVRERLPLAVATLARGPAALAILDAIHAMKADLVVMGTHGRSGVAHLVLGSVAQRVVRASPVPVLTVRGEPSRDSALMGNEGAARASVPREMSATKA